MWLYQCKLAGLTVADLKDMRIDQAEAWIELHEFIHDSALHAEEYAAQKNAEDAFWGL